MSAFDAFRASALDFAPYGSLRSSDGTVDRLPAGGGLTLDDDAGQSLQDDLDATQLIDTAARAIHIVDAYGDPRDEAGVLAELGSDALPDVRPRGIIELESGRA